MEKNEEKPRTVPWDDVQGWAAVSVFVVGLAGWMRNAWIVLSLMVTNDQVSAGVFFLRLIGIFPLTPIGVVMGFID